MFVFVLIFIDPEDQQVLKDSIYIYLNFMILLDFFNRF